MKKSGGNNSKIIMPGITMVVIYLAITMLALYWVLNAAVAGWYVLNTLTLPWSLVIFLTNVSEGRMFITISVTVVGVVINSALIYLFFNYWGGLLSKSVLNNPSRASTRNNTVNLLLTFVVYLILHWVAGFVLSFLVTFLYGVLGPEIYRLNTAYLSSLGATFLSYYTFFRFSRNVSNTSYFIRVLGEKCEKCIKVLEKQYVHIFLIWLVFVSLQGVGDRVLFMSGILDPSQLLKIVVQLFAFLSSYYIVQTLDKMDNIKIYQKKGQALL